MGDNPGRKGVASEATAERFSGGAVRKAGYSRRFRFSRQPVTSALCPLIIHQSEFATAMNVNQDALNELFYYTTAHRDPSFIHQHVVDAIAAQTVNENDKPIKLTFALIGLYLHVEKGFSGKEVQLAHMKMGRRKHTWPLFHIPETRGTITINDVLDVPPGTERDKMIHQWCASVWEAFRENRQLVVKLLNQYRIV